MLIKTAKATQAVQAFVDEVKKRWKEEGLDFKELSWTNLPKRLWKGGDAAISARKREIVDELRKERLKKVWKELDSRYPNPNVDLDDPDILNRLSEYALENRDAVAMLKSLIKNERKGLQSDGILEDDFTHLFRTAAGKSDSSLNILDNPNYVKEKDFSEKPVYGGKGKWYKATPEMKAWAKNRYGSYYAERGNMVFVPKDGDVRNMPYSRDRVSPYVNMSEYFNDVAEGKAGKVSGVERLLGGDEDSYNRTMRYILGENSAFPPQNAMGKSLEPEKEFPWTKALAGGAAGLAGLVGLHEILKDDMAR